MEWTADQYTTLAGLLLIMAILLIAFGIYGYITRDRK